MKENVVLFYLHNGDLSSSLNSHMWNLKKKLPSINQHINVCVSACLPVCLSACLPVVNVCLFIAVRFCMCVCASLHANN